MKVCRNLSELAREVKESEFVCEEKFINSINRGLFFISDYKIEVKAMNGKTLFFVEGE